MIKIMFFILVLSGCAPLEPLSRVPADTYDLLLQERNGTPRYVFFKKDSAFYEKRIFDKPEYFTDHDTLIHAENCNCYVGKTMTLTFKEGFGNITLRTGQDTGNTFSFTIPSAKQLQTWNYYKNSDSYSGCIQDVNDILTVRQDPKLYQQAESDFRNVIKLAKRLDHKSFDTELEKIKLKYSIKCLPNSR